MQNKIEQYKKLAYEYAQRLSDVRFLGQVIFVVIVLLISWSGVKSIQTNYGLQKQISALKQQNELQKLQNNNLKLQNQYYNSNQYLELSARQNLGLGAAGEKELLVPKAVALSYAPDLGTATPTNSYQPKYQSNFQAWVNFFLHRQVSAD